ncbi:YkgJ family cysteine cluster protein [Shinella sumterensis]|uniref:YkgJ family cysteine cluster protein n=1 Tax=Shinella sumterensis TaxID=1967501 RepID=UPI003F86E0C9
MPQAEDRCASPTPATVPGRACGSCTLCCRLPDIDLFDKPANAWCTHCIEHKGCSIYAARPSVCRDFLCLWMTDPALGADWDPSRSHMMIYRQGPQMTVLVDPDHADIWRRDPYCAQLQAWAAEGAPVGNYVIVFQQDDVFKI